VSCGYRCRLAARDEAGPDSEIDIAVRLGESFSTGGFDYFFWRLEQLEQRLSQMLGPRLMRWRSQCAKSVSKTRSTGPGSCLLTKPRAGCRTSSTMRKRSSATSLQLHQGMDLAAFEEDRKTYDAVERCLERISEAATKRADLAPVLMPDQPWQKIRTFGNVLRHEYDAVREDVLFEIVTKDLPGPSAAAAEALRLWNIDNCHNDGSHADPLRGRLSTSLRKFDHVCCARSSRPGAG